jgi:hypothetical protein
MFNQISMWQMAVDLCLVTSILFMAFRSIKSSRTQALLPQMMELENRVLKLMAEAEGSAKHLNDTLLRREQNIHRYVSDLEKREKDISMTVSEGESLSKELSLMCESARREAEELAHVVSDSERVRTERRGAATDNRRASEPSRRERTTRYADEESIEEDYRNEQRSFSTRGSSKRASEWLDEPEAPRLEREDATSRRASAQRLQELYHTAEEMLKNGQKPRDVSEKTKLPFEGLERLAQMIEIEREERREQQRSSAPAQKDSRLGALGVSRRNASTL